MPRAALVPTESGCVATKVPRPPMSLLCPGGLTLIPYPVEQLVVAQGVHALPEAFVPVHGELAFAGQAFQRGFFQVAAFLFAQVVEKGLFKNEKAAVGELVEQGFFLQMGRLQSEWSDDTLDH